MSSRLLCCTGSLDGGGSERQLWQLATRINPTQFESQIYLLARRGTYLDRVPSHIPVHAFADSPVASANSFGSNLRIPGTIHRRQVAHLRSILVRECIDIVYDRTYHMTLVTAAACRQLHVPRVSVIVSPPSLDLANSRERYRWFKRWILARAYRAPGAIPVAVSSAVAEDAARFYGLRRDSIRVVENPIDVSAVQQQAMSELPWAEQQHGQRSSLRVVVVGRISHEKGQKFVIHALARVRQSHPEINITLHLIGDGPDANLLRDLVHQLGLRAQVQLHGFQANPYPWIKQADVVCIPSQFEGLPNVALEAMAIGTPLLATACSSSLVDLISADQLRGVLVPVGDIAQIAEKLIDRHLNPLDWEKRAARAQAWVTEHYGLEKSMHAVEKLLSETLALHKLRGDSA